jgi:hypothetical protein
MTGDVGNDDENMMPPESKHTFRYVDYDGDDREIQAQVMWGREIGVRTSFCVSLEDSKGKLMISTEMIDEIKSKIVDPRLKLKEESKWKKLR